MRVGIFPTSTQACQAGADIILKQWASKPEGVLGVATGSTPEGLYAILRQAHSEGRFTLASSKAFALDEYVGIAEDHPERYRNVLRRNLVGEDKTGLSDEALNTPDGSAADPYAAADAYEAAIAAAGGADIQILGIGVDGHIGFNEPGGSFASTTHVEALAGQTIADNARFFEGDRALVPTRCITQGLSTIMSAKKLLLLAFGENKAEAIRQVLEGAISAKWPATIMQMHPDATVLLDEAAASKLEFTELYRERWALRH